MTDAIVEATVVDDPGTDIEPRVHGTLFHTDDPVEVVERATRAADALKDVLRQRNLIQNISGKEHVKVEGWTLLGSMLGVAGVVEWTRPIESGWEARVAVRTLDGRVIGAAEAECLRTERMWAKRDDYALRSMAQTRAMSKALRGPLGFVVHLAGYEATPADEMPGQPDSASAASDPALTVAQWERICAELIARDLEPTKVLLALKLPTDRALTRSEAFKIREWLDHQGVTA